MKNMRMFIGLCLSLGMLVSVAVPGLAAEKGTVSVGWEEWPPYSYRDANQQLTGLDIELVTTIFTKLGYKVTYRETGTQRLFKELEEGTTTIATSAFKTAEREEFAYFSDLYQSASIVLFVKKGEAAKYPFKTLTALKGTGFRLGVRSGAAYSDEYVALQKDPDFAKQLQEVAVVDQNVLKLANGRIDGLIEGYAVVLPVAQKLGMFDQLEILFAVQRIPLRIMMSKKMVTPDVVAAFNAELAAMKKAGTYQKLFEKYQLTPEMSVEP